MMSDQCVGEIRIFAGPYAPEDWAFCNGAVLKIADNQELFALIGNAYGGDGTTTFALPDLCDRLPIGQGQAAASKTVYELGIKGGAKEVTLAEAEMPEHSHSPVGTTTAATSCDPSNNLMAKAVNSDGGTNQDIMYLRLGAKVLASTTLHENAVSKVGANQPHDNIMPCSGVNFIIALKGVFPDFS